MQDHRSADDSLRSIRGDTRRVTVRESLTWACLLPNGRVQRGMGVSVVRSWTSYARITMGKEKSRVGVLRIWKNDRRIQGRGGAKAIQEHRVPGEPLTMRFEGQRPAPMGSALRGTLRCACTGNGSTRRNSGKTGRCVSRFSHPNGKRRENLARSIVRFDERELLD